MSLEVAPAAENRILTVEQLNMQIRSLIEGQVGMVWIQAEISNFKPHTSGHFYFSLKDSKSQISAVMFRGHNSKLKFKPHDGLEVIVRGRITVYEPRGQYQVAVESMDPVGAGALQKQFEQLKEKLKLEGLFDSIRKKPIPAHPQKVAIVTSPTGAAIQDILNIMNRRAKSVEVIVVPTIVQGAAAAPQLCEAFQRAEKLNPDVIIIGRGGGSIEDMWCFNDERLARLIAGSFIPVISAVGHEIDFTICDFVADLRAPTPSAAAELVAKSSAEIAQKLIQLDRSLAFSMKKRMDMMKQSVLHLSKRLTDPKKKLQDLMLRSDDLFNRLENAIAVNINHLKKDVQILQSKLISPVQVISSMKLNLDKKNMRLHSLMNFNIQNQKSQVQNLMSLLDSLSPLKVVERGFSITKRQDELVKSIKQVKIKDLIEVRVKDGFIDAEIIKLRKLENEGV
ncbi:MAG: exodeoxyribonuclease VII large subunit [Moraxellaceae bacterium]|nr:exodeoxyribonuclease VII large subunit [Pseudobdellovibrionaceae bacterium]